MILIAKFIFNPHIALFIYAISCFIICDMLRLWQIFTEEPHESYTEQKRHG